MGPSDFPEMETPMGTTSCTARRTFDGDCYSRVYVSINFDLYSILLISPNAAICRLIRDIDYLSSPSSLIYSLLQPLPSNK